LKDGARRANPMNLSLPGAYGAALPPVCNMVVSFNVETDGTVRQTAGACPQNCAAIHAV